MFLAILGCMGFTALGVAMLYMDGPLLIAWMTILFFGLGGIWLIAKQIYGAATPKSRPDFVDLDLRLVELSQNASGEYHVKAEANFDGRVVGFAIVLGSDWEHRPSTGFTWYSGTVFLRAAGNGSDAFIDVLAARYGTPTSTRRMLPEIAAQAVGLNSDPREVALRPVRMKLFFHPEVEDRYAEVYVNIDAANRLVQFHEKDMEHRGNVLRALTEAVAETRA